MFLQGSDFDGQKLIEINENKSEIVALPIINLYWNKHEDTNNNKKDNSMVRIH